MLSLPEPIMKHSIGVAEFMAKYAEEHPNLHLNPYKYYVIGLLHDIGKLYPGDYDPNGKNLFKNHAQKGGALLEDLGFYFAKDIKHHGHPEDKYYSRTWLILNLADLSVNGKGEIINIEDRIRNIGERYGKNSEEYLNAKTMYEILKKENMI